MTATKLIKNNPFLRLSTTDTHSHTNKDGSDQSKSEGIEPQSLNYHYCRVKISWRKSVRSTKIIFQSHLHGTITIHVSLNIRMKI
jgi:hypothetical protein